MARKPKRMRLPNGFGQISEIKNRNLRKPFRAMVTVGTSETGRPICKILKPQGYFATYNEAYAALIKYHENPYVGSSDMTMEELYEKWSERHFETVGKSAKASINAAWRYCASIYKMKVVDVKMRHLKQCIDDGTVVRRGTVVHTTAITKKRIKNLFNCVFDYAVEYEIVERNIARELVLKTRKSEENKKPAHMAFTDDEMDILWKNKDEHPFAAIMLIQCYSGWRPAEMGKLTIENTNLTDWTFTSGVKTSNGINRTVPIHTKIKDLVKEKYEEADRIGSEYLFNLRMGHDNGYDNFIEYYKYRYMFQKTVAQLGLNPEHSPHDCRKHFVTMAKKYEVNDFAIKRIVGHSITDITERIYTERNLDWIRSEIEKIR